MTENKNINKKTTKQIQNAGLPPMCFRFGVAAGFLARRGGLGSDKAAVPTLTCPSVYREQCQRDLKFFAIQIILES